MDYETYMKWVTVHELELVKFKIFEFVEQLRIELSQGNSMIKKYIDSKIKSKD